MNIKDSNQREELEAVVRKIMDQQAQEAQALRAKWERLMKRLDAMSPDEIQKLVNKHLAAPKVIRLPGIVPK